MEQYRYTELNHAVREIRLVTLQPGYGDEQIRLSIRHHSFHPQETPSASPVVSSREIQATLPDGWLVDQTLDGRYIFRQKRQTRSGTKGEGNHEGSGGKPQTSWKHPRTADIPLPTRAPYHALRDPDIPSFEALSYTWGSPLPAKAVSVVDLSNINQEGSKLTVGENLAGALHYLRLTDHPRVLWVDAICINQADHAERARQVVRMGEIYKASTRVVTWLGLPAADSRLGLQVLDHLGSQAELLTTLSCVPSPDAGAEGSETQDWWDPHALLPYKAETWNSIWEVISRGYFDRLWVFQEMSLAPPGSVMYCGYDFVSYKNFRNALVVLRDKISGTSAEPRWNNRLGFVLNVILTGRQSTFERLLMLRANRKCSDSRDAVYGVLGLAPPGLVAHLKPDYKASLADVYKLAFLEYLKYSQSLILLKHCSLDNVLPGGAPTWVPNWASSTYGNGPFLGFEYNASPSVSASWVELPGSVLAVEGIHITTIQSLATTVMRNLPSDLIQLVREAIEAKTIVDEGTSPSPAAIQDNHMLRQLLWTVSMGKLRDVLHTENRPTFAEFRDTVLAEIYGNQAWIKSPKARSLMTRPFLKRKALAYLDMGLFALVPENAQQGDEIFVILGCDSPMLLRPVIEEDSSRVKHQIVGRCYCNFVMRGEALLGHLLQPWVYHPVLDETGMWKPGYENVETGVVTAEDPRGSAVASSSSLASLVTVNLI
ncbi:heterokaryon incompatibility protein-domain-containing protein [Xylariales sp. PMI_506]|nr:heterokaryon incompatibility protein-domain-containing protein [Xylariales sp. PMI_506]